MGRVMVVGSTGFVGRNLINYLRVNGRSCIAVSRSLLTNQSLDQISLIDFNNYSKSDFEELKIDYVVYALGDPNMNGKKNSESVVLRNFLSKLEEFHFKGKFMLISSNAASPDSALTPFSYRKTLKNAYIERKQLLENIVLSSNFHVIVFRSPAVIGIDMNDFSHIKRILGNRLIAKTMSLGIFRGSVEIITIENLSEEILNGLIGFPSRSIIEPCSPSYRWSKLAGYLYKGSILNLEKLEILNKFEQSISIFLPVSLRFLLFPHWVTKHGSDSEVLRKHKEVLESLSKIRNVDVNEGKSVIVTGVASGLGAEVAEMLLQKNHKVLGIDILEPTQSLNVLKFSQNINFQYIRGDLTSSDFIEQILKFIETCQIDGVFSIAGKGRRLNVKNMRSDELLEIFRINFFAQVELANLLVKRRRPGSFFVYVGSSSGIEGLPNFAAYSASKAAVQAYFFSLICELNERDIRLLGVIPSGMKTNFQHANGVPNSKFDKFLLDDPAKIARFIVDWSIKSNKKTRIKYFGISSWVFLFLRNLPFFVKSKVVRSISEGTR